MRDWKASTLFDERQRAVIGWAETLTDNRAREDDSAFAAMKAHFDEREIVELTLFTCMFNAWNRFQDGLHNELEAPEARVCWQDWKGSVAAPGRK